MGIIPIAEYVNPNYAFGDRRNASRCVFGPSGLAVNWTLARTLFITSPCALTLTGGQISGYKRQFRPCVQLSFRFPQHTVTQVNDHRLLWGKTRRLITVYTCHGVIGSFPLETQLPLQSTNLGSENWLKSRTWARGHGSLTGVPSSSLLRIHSPFALIIYIKQCPCWLPIYFAPANAIFHK